MRAIWCGRLSPWRGAGSSIDAIPPAFTFEGEPGLSRELVQRFSQTRPETLGQALRIPGATPAAVAVLGAYLRQHAAAARSVSRIGG